MTVHVLLAMALVLLAVAPLSAAPAALEHVDVYNSGQDGYATYRIPTIETAPDGSLLAFAEARKYHGSDPGEPGEEIDLVLKRSTDGGRTWSPMRVIEHAGAYWSSANAATVVDRSRRRVWVLYLRSRPGGSTDASRAGTDDMASFARWSDDCGVTWSGAVDINAATRDMADPAWKCTVFGPGGAIQTRTGRLLVAAWRATPYVPFAVYSDDHGVTWRRGAVIPGATGGNECQVVELTDGSILMDIRQNDGPHRWFATSTDGGATWSAPHPGDTVSAVACAIERYRRGGRSALVWTGPRGPARRKLVARVSTDDGRTFGRDRVITEGLAAYSDLTTLKDGRPAVLWERDNYQHITCTVLPREFLSEP